MAREKKKFKCCRWYELQAILRGESANETNVDKSTSSSFWVGCEFECKDNRENPIKKVRYIVWFSDGDVSNCYFTAKNEKKSKTEREEGS